MATIRRKMGRFGVTVMAAVTAGVPMVCTPMGRDQYAISRCVERLGLGRVASMTAPPEALRRTIVATLEDDALHARARTFAAGQDVEAGLSRALGVLEALQVPEASRDTGARATTTSRGEYGRLS